MRSFLAKEGKIAYTRGMNATEIRERYLKFFEKRGHTVIPSASLIPEGDSTLLFVNSGMFPLVPYLMGQTHPGGVRLVDSQKCFRMEDIDEVGDNRHNTFFEMLGNWSLGDYFKKEQLNWWYEFLVEDLKIDPSRLYATVYGGSSVAPKDEESIAILLEIFSKYEVKVKEGVATPEGAKLPFCAPDFEAGERVFPYVEKNWWQRGDAVGELGGPDSETFYDTGREHQSEFGEFCHVNCDCGRFIEIGNSVFMQYQMAKDGWKEMDQKNVDFGGGLERIAMAMQGKDNVFETDLFLPMIKKIQELSGVFYRENMRSFEIIADHLKAVSFLMGDPKGIGPSNVGQGYMVRRLIRRALRYGRQLGISQERWMKGVAEKILDVYGKQYPEISENAMFVFAELEREEEKFRVALERGLKEFDRKYPPMEAEFTREGEEPFAWRPEEHRISITDAFYFFQTYGFPFEMIEELVEERGYTIDKAKFREEYEEHQNLSRTASAGMFKGGLADHSDEVTKLHTATHLLLAALRKILGDHVTQKGSNITAERLRLDFPHSEKVSDAKLKEVEELVNKAIERNLPVEFEEMTLEEARAKGAVGVFGERYGERVKVYRIGEEKNPFSLEICGGPHVATTKDLGRFTITKEEAVSAGVRRIRAVLKEKIA